MLLVFEVLAGWGRSFFKSVKALMIGVSAGMTFFGVALAVSSVCSCHRANLDAQLQYPR